LYLGAFNVILNACECTAPALVSPSQGREIVLRDYVWNYQLLDNGPINIGTTEVIVAAVVDDADTSILGFHYCGIEGSAAKVIDEPEFLRHVGLKSVGKSSGNWFLEQGAL